MKLESLESVSLVSMVLVNVKRGVLLLVVVVGSNTSNLFPREMTVRPSSFVLICAIL